MFVRREAPDGTFRFGDAEAFIAGDVCGFLMKRLSRHAPAVYRHSVRVAVSAASVAEAMGMGPDLLPVFFRSALLHDIGMLSLPAEPARTRTPLGPDEWRRFERHPAAGAELLRHLIEEGRVMEDVILHHHENLDGSGYPFGKTEPQLSLPARIVRVADSFDAAVYGTGFARVKPEEEALEDLYRWSDICFDANVVGVFHMMLNRKREPRG